MIFEVIDEDELKQQAEAFCREKECLLVKTALKILSKLGNGAMSESGLRNAIRSKNNGRGAGLGETLQFLKQRGYIQKRGEKYDLSDEILKDFIDFTGDGDD